MAKKKFSFSSSSTITDNQFPLKCSFRSWLPSNRTCSGRFPIRSNKEPIVIITYQVKLQKKSNNPNMDGLTPAQGLKMKTKFFNLQIIKFKFSFLFICFFSVPLCSKNARPLRAPRQGVVKGNLKKVWCFIIGENLAFAVENASFLALAKQCFDFVSFLLWPLLLLTSIWNRSACYGR